jgi:hypothetical protein
VLSYDGGELADGGPAGMPPGYVEQHNWFDLSGGQQLQWGGTVTSGEYISFSGQGLNTVFLSPNLMSTSPSNPNFTPGNMVRDTGITTPASGALSMGCDGGILNYCGTAPEPGAVELIP